MSSSVMIPVAPLCFPMVASVGERRKTMKLSSPSVRLSWVVCTWTVALGEPAGMVTVCASAV